MSSDNREARSRSRMLISLLKDIAGISNIFSSKSGTLMLKKSMMCHWDQLRHLNDWYIKVIDLRTKRL